MCILYCNDRNRIRRNESIDTNIASSKNSDNLVHVCRVRRTNDENYNNFPNEDEWIEM